MSSEAHTAPVFGLLGRTLGHSYSPRIHAELGSYDYRLFEKEPEEVAEFLQSGEFAGINVTIPYKETVMPLCHELSDAARRIGCVNTVVRREDGTLYGHNTDYDGFAYLLKQSGISVQDRKVLVLGTGGASKTACAVLEDLGAAEIVAISRKGPNTYDNLEKHNDAHVIVNTTPVGMYPQCPASPLDLEPFARTGELREGRADGLFGVVDVVYNPSRTGLMLQAEKLGVPHISGLPMLVAQAKAASELFQGVSIADSVMEGITQRIAADSLNIVLIGMPSGGKSTIGALLAERLGRTFVDVDQHIPEAAGKPIPDIFAQDGEEAFRAIETQVTGDICKKSSQVIACGGGVVTRARNYDLLHQNGVIVLLKRPLDMLETDGRPMSQQKGVARLARERGHIYDAWADVAITNDATAEEAVQRILQALATTDLTQ